MNTAQHSAAASSCEDHNVQEARKATQPGAANPLGFEPIASESEPDAALIRLASKLEAGIVCEQRMADNDGLEAQIERTSAIVDLILPIRATTAAGLAVKLRAWMWAENNFTPEAVAADSDVTSTKIMASVCADALALQSGVGFVPPSLFDGSLIAAWTNHQRVGRELLGLREKAETLAKQVVPMLPPIPEALFVREDDFDKTSLRFAGALLRDDGRPYYERNVIAFLRTNPKIIEPYADRAAAIVEAHDAWEVGCAAVRAKTGLHETMEAVAQAEERLNTLADQILEIPALSLRGIGIKASWALTHKAEGERDVSGVLQQIEAFTRRHAYMDMHNVPGLERDVMGGLPCADWNLYSRFTRWLEAANTFRALDEAHSAASAQDEDGEEAHKLFALMGEAGAREWALRKAIRDTRATSLQGMQLKACVYAWLCGGDDGMRENEVDHGGGIGGMADTGFAFNIAREMALLGVPGVLDTGTKPERKADDRALQSYRAWLEMEYRSLTHEMYPDQPDMPGLLYTDVAGARFHFRDEPPASSRAERILDMFGMDWRSDNSPSWKNPAERAA